MNLCNEMEIIRQNIKFQKNDAEKNIIIFAIRSCRYQTWMKKLCELLIYNIVKYNACIYTITNNSVSFFMNSVNIYEKK